MLSRFRTVTFSLAPSRHRFVCKALLMGNSTSVEDSDPSPWFAHGLETPKFKTEPKKNEETEYEVRRYPATKWVSTEVQSMSYTDAATTGFRRLFKYIMGGNSAGTRIPMTSPVACKIQPSQGPACESSFRVHFFVPASHQENTPTPSSKDVALVEYPEFMAYVLSYSGFNSNEKLLEHATRLGQQLEQDGVEFDKDHYFCAGYDPPYRLFNRHNEIWYVATPPTANGATGGSSTVAEGSMD